MRTQTRHTNGQFGPAVQTAPEVLLVQDTPIFPEEWLDAGPEPDQTEGDVSLGDPESWPAPPF